MKNLRMLALLLAGIFATNVVFAKSTNGDNTTSKKRMTRSEKRAVQDEKWVEGDAGSYQPSDVRYESYSSAAGEVKAGRGGKCGRGGCNTCPQKNSDGCTSVTEAPCAKPPVCRKLVPVEACAQKHKHVTYSYTCPPGYIEHGN